MPFCSLNGSQADNYKYVCSDNSTIINSEVIFKMCEMYFVTVEHEGLFVCSETTISGR